MMCIVSTGAADEDRTWDRSQVIGTVMAAVWLVGFTLVDLASPGSIVLAPLFALSPLIASAVLPGLPTAVFGVLALVLSIGSGWWSDTWDDPQQVIRVVDVALVSSAAVLVAVVRVRRERRHQRVSAIAEVARLMADRGFNPTVNHRDIARR